MGRRGHAVLLVPDQCFVHVLDGGFVAGEIATRDGLGIDESDACDAVRRFFAQIDEPYGKLVWDGGRFEGGDRRELHESINRHSDSDLDVLSVHVLRITHDHDVLERLKGDGVAIPYGIYDLQSNRGTVYVGTSYDTSQFAVECIEKWWRSEGQKRFPGRKHLLVVADTGGSNGATRRAWKHGIQHKLCNEHGLDVTVAHYPPGASKWNPIEHRLFSEISKNWAGRPLDSYETILNFIRTTKTKTGLKVNARLVKKQYPKGIKISDPAMALLNIKKSSSLPKWNYTLRPSKNGK